MKKFVLVVATVMATFVFAAGCRLAPYTGPYTPPPFDPQGTWIGSNDTFTNVLAEYIDDIRPISRANMESRYLHVDSQTFFGPATSITSGGTPAILSTASSIRVRYALGSSFADVDLTGRHDDRDFIRVPVNRSGYARVQLLYGTGTEGSAHDFLFSTGCYYRYRVFLDLRFNTDSYMTGSLISRFDWYNDTANADFDNPTCDEIFAAFQADFDAGAETYADDGLLYPLVNGTVADDLVTPRYAVDPNHIIDLLGLQFNNGFDASWDNRSTRHHTEGHIDTDINVDFLRAGVMRPEVLFARLQTPEACARINTLLAQVRASGVVDSHGLRTGAARPPIEELLSRELVNTPAPH